MEEETWRAGRTGLSVELSAVQGCAGRRPVARKESEMLVTQVGCLVDGDSSEAELA